jgi:hypothetical protein
MRRSDVHAALMRVAPRIPAFEAGAILDHAMTSRGLAPASAETAAWLSLVAFVRHTMTDYDDLMAEGYDQSAARYLVAGEMARILEGWRVRRPLIEEV